MSEHEHDRPSNLIPLGMADSFGFGDRLGLATPGHIAAVRDTGLLPVFAQQSVRENVRTGRTPRQVLEDARRAVDACGWDRPWSADADHIRNIQELDAFVRAGYTCFTVDPGEFVDAAAEKDAPEVLLIKAQRYDWPRIRERYLQAPRAGLVDGFTENDLLRAVVKYEGAVLHAAAMYRRLAELTPSFDFEISVDETELPTSPGEHFFIASELASLGVRFTALALRFPGRFEKGVDYIGDLSVLDSVMQSHAAVRKDIGNYKISLHSGSDKFSIYPCFVRNFAGGFHVKTAGTSYLEALRVVAAKEPALFRRLWQLAMDRYPAERASYHVSAMPNRVPLIERTAEFPTLLDDFHAREILHVTYGAVLSHYGLELKAALTKHAEAYYEALVMHFRHHLDLLVQREER